MSGHAGRPRPPWRAEDLLPRHRADAGSRGRRGRARPAPPRDPDGARSGQHRLADATARTGEPLRRLSQAIGHRQQVAEDEGIERDEGGVRLPEALLIDQQPQPLPGRDGKVAMAIGTDAERLERRWCRSTRPHTTGTLAAPHRSRPLGRRSCSLRQHAAQGLIRETRVAGARVVSWGAPSLVGGWRIHPSSLRGILRTPRAAVKRISKRPCPVLEWRVSCHSIRDELAPSERASTADRLPAPRLHQPVRRQSGGRRQRSAASRSPSRPEDGLPPPEQRTRV